MKQSLKDILNKEASLRNSKFELSKLAKPDPVQVAHIYKDEYISLICALFAYGNAKMIVKYLESLDFSLLDKDEDEIKNSNFSPYRFQNSEDVKTLFLSLNRLKKDGSLNEFFLPSYLKNRSILEGINSLQKAIFTKSDYSSRGYSFLIGNIDKKTKGTFKRWLLYLRWMVRKDEIDLGLWSGVKKEDLLIPLDTHTHKVSLALKLIDRKRYDLETVIKLTNALKKFDPKDPVKYDFALYRVGQEKKIKLINA